MFQFTVDCLLGIEQIDEEHKHLFELLNKAHILSTTEYHSDYYNELKGIIEELDEYADEHFEHEEAYMEEIRDPELIRQRSQHAFFREKVREFDFANIDHEEQQQELLENLVMFLAKWLYRHIVGSDILIGKLPPLEEWLIKENPCEFTDEYLTGIYLIDKEHAELFRIVDKANKLVRNYDDSCYDKFVEILNELREYTREHFADEEEYMESINYAGLDAQRRAHQAFVEKLETLELDKIDEKHPQDDLEELVEYLLGWLINHILNSDKKIPSNT